MHEDLARLARLHWPLGRANVVTATASEIEGAARSAEAAVLCRIAPAESPSSVWQRASNPWFRFHSSGFACAEGD